MDQPSAKKNQITELPYEIWNQILLCLPAKTVIGLKSVCKSWRDLINSHNFQISHVDTWRNRFPSQVIAISPHRSALELLSLDLAGTDIPSNVRCSPLRFEQFLLRRFQCQLSGGPIPPKETTVLDCCDGLFLIGMSKHVYLCNPLTNSYLALPFPKMNNGLDFSTVSPHSWTIVYDPSTRDYVIFYIGYGNHFPRFCVVFSLRVDLMTGVCGGRRCGDWRKIWSSENLTLKFPDIRVLYFLAGVSINGKVHWLFHFLKRAYDRYNTDNTGILTIDVATEESIVTKCSATPTSGSSFFKSDKKFYCLKEFYAWFELWAIDNVDSPKWLKQCVIIKMDFKMMNLYRLSRIVKEGNRLIMRSKNSVFIYDINLKKWHVLDIVDSDGNTDRWSVLMSINFSLLGWN